MSIDTVIFDLDGVVLHTEQVWHTVRRDFALAHGFSPPSEEATGAADVVLASVARLTSGVVGSLREEAACGV